MVRRGVQHAGTVYGLHPCRILQKDAVAGGSWHPHIKQQGPQVSRLSLTWAWLQYLWRWRMRSRQSLGAAPKDPEPPRDPDPPDPFLCTSNVRQHLPS